MRYGIPTPDHPLDEQAALALADFDDLPNLMVSATRVRQQARGRLITYSPKVFIPLTKLCRDSCHYCTFATAPRQLPRAYMTIQEVLEVAISGKNVGCREALFTLGDKPEHRYRVARHELDELGFRTTAEYLYEACGAVVRETGLLPHVNAGVLTADEMARLRAVSASQGIMLESASERLCEKGMPHHGSPDKMPSVRLAAIADAGRLRIPMTSGILIGIGETRRERIEALLRLRDLHREFGHIQEVIIQNFRAKPGTRMAGHPEPSLNDHLWTIAVARLIMDPEVAIQAPPNLRASGYGSLLAAGLDDWGGVSPVTPDYVNPEAPWPSLQELRHRTAEAGATLVPRLTLHPTYVRNWMTWVDPALRRHVLDVSDGNGFAREDDWAAGCSVQVPSLQMSTSAFRSREIERLVEKARSGVRLHENEVATLFNARGADFRAICAHADELRQETCGNEVGYVVNRNINYTNVCGFRCQFCAFSKGRTSQDLRGRPYELAIEEVVRRACEAWERGATEVCMQGGIHPDYTGDTYITLARAVRDALPGMHIHAFSPLEVSQGAQTLGKSVPEFLADLRAAGVGSLPGTAAEILDDRVRSVLCPDKIATEEWLEIVQASHMLGIPTTSTMMFGHVDDYQAWARHLLAIRDLQAKTGGITEFVPLPFVAHEAPIYLKGRARRGATFREAILVHAVARLVLHPLVTNIQTSWTKMGVEGAKASLGAGANDLGGTLMNESISRAAGSLHGQELAPERMEDVIMSVGRVPRQRTTLYQAAPPDRVQSSFVAKPLSPIIETPLARKLDA